MRLLVYNLGGKIIGWALEQFFILAFMDCFGDKMS